MDFLIALFSFLLLVNGAALVLFAYDKINAIKRGWRIRESTLLTVAFFGPFGAYLAMKVFRHKTRKLKFLLVRAFMALHVILAAIYIYYFAM